MHKNSTPVYLSIYLGTPVPLPPPKEKNSLGANDVMSMFVHVLSFECCALLQTCECRGSLLSTVADTEVVYLKFEVSVYGI